MVSKLKAYMYSSFEDTHTNEWKDRTGSYGQNHNEKAYSSSFETVYLSFDRLFKATNV